MLFHIFDTPRKHSCIRIGGEAHERERNAILRITKDLRSLLIPLSLVLWTFTMVLKCLQATPCLRQSIACRPHKAARETCRGRRRACGNGAESTKCKASLLALQGFELTELRFAPEAHHSIQPSLWVEAGSAGALQIHRSHQVTEVGKAVRKVRAGRLGHRRRGTWQVGPNLSENRATF
jgi:hypothetical protein